MVKWKEMIFNRLWQAFRIKTFSESFRTMEMLLLIDIKFSFYWFVKGTVNTFMQILSWSINLIIFSSSESWPLIKCSDSLQLANFLLLNLNASNFKFQK